MQSKLLIGSLSLAAALFGCAPVTPVPPGSTALANAVVDRKIDQVDQLLSSGASPNSADERGTPAIVLASATDQFQLAVKLAENQANLWATDKMGYTAAIYANTSHISDDSDEGAWRLKFINLLKNSGYPWPPPWPKDVLELQKNGKWPRSQVPR